MQVSEFRSKQQIVSMYLTYRLIALQPALHSDRLAWIFTTFHALL